MPGNPQQIIKINDWGRNDDHFFITIFPGKHQLFQLKLFRGTVAQTCVTGIKSPQGQGSMDLITPSRRAPSVLSNGKPSFRIIKRIKTYVC